MRRGRSGAAVLAAVNGLRGLGLSAAGTLEEMAMLLQQMAVLGFSYHLMRRRN